MVKSQFSYRPDVDGLRAVAVLAVVAYHAAPALLPGGFVGVDIFFVISGFLISGIILRALENGTFTLLGFWARRIRRIFPALILVLLVVWAIGWVVLRLSEFVQLGRLVASGAGFAANIELWREAGYFDAIAESKPLLHLWSLGVEEQFYLIWPTALVLAWRCKVESLKVITVLGLLSFVANLLWIRRSPSSTFYLPMTRFWELLIGAAIASREATLRKFCGQFPNVLSILGAVAIAGSASLLNKSIAYPGIWAVPPALGAALIIVAGEKAWLNGAILSARPFVALGLISYPLYLWHFPMLVFARLLEYGEPRKTVVLATVLVSCLLAAATYKFIELPVRKARARGRLVAQLAVSLGAVFLLGVISFARPSLIQKHETDPRQSDIESFNKLEFTGRCESDSSEDLDSWCFVSHNSEPNIAIYGDSHAHHLYPGLAGRDSARTWMLIGHSSCPPLKGIHVFRDGTRDSCEAFNDAALHVLVSKSSIRTVVLASLGTFYLSDIGVAPEHTGALAPSRWKLTSDDVGEATLASKSQLFERGLTAAVEVLVSAGKEVVLYLDTPEMPTSAQDCIERPLALKPAPKCRKPLEAVLARQSEYREILQRIIRREPSVHMFDPTSVLCDSAECVMGRGSVLYYRDGHHLSLRGSQLLGDHFVSWLQAIHH